MKARKTKPVRFRLHIDHIDNCDGDVWAVRFGTTYLTAHRVELFNVPLLICCQVRRCQPRAYVEGWGRVSVQTSPKGERTIVIEGV